MNRRLVVVVVTGWITFFLGALSPLYADLRTGLVAYYPFDGTANDASGNGNNGTRHGGSFTTDRNSAANGAYLFNGTSDYIDCATAWQLTNSYEHTIAVWVKSTKATEEAQAIAGYLSINYGYGLVIRWHDGRFGMMAGDGTSWNYASGPDVLQGDGRWHFLAGTRSGGITRIYVDGVLSTISTAHALGLDSCQVLIGWSGVSGLQYFEGALDDLRFYNRALSSDEVQQLYAADNDLNAGLVAHYPLDGNANDASGNGNNGTLNGSLSFVPGQHGSAAQFDGASTYIEVADSPSLSITNSITLSCWIRTSGQNGANVGIINNLGSTDRDGFLVCLNPSVAGATCAADLDFNWPTVMLGLHPTVPLQDGIWHHLAMTYDGQMGHFWIDGVVRASSTTNYTAGMSHNQIPVTIGWDRSAEQPSGRHFNGLIDEVRIYNRALSATEITQLYTLAGTNSAPNPTISNVHVQTNGSNVRIWYSLAGAFQTIPVVTLISTNDGQSYDLQGPSSAAVAPGNTCFLTWDASQQLPNQTNSRVRVRVIAGSAVGETPQSFTVVTSDAGDRPVVRDVRSGYCWGTPQNGRHVCYLSGVTRDPITRLIPFTQDFTVSVDWNGRSPGTVHYLCPEAFEGLSYTRTLNISGWYAGAKLKVIAEASDGTQSAPFIANFDVIPPPPLASMFLYASALLDSPDGLEYRAPSFDLDIFKGPSGPVSGVLARCLPGETMEVSPMFKAEAQVDGSGVLTIDAVGGKNNEIKLNGTQNRRPDGRFGKAAAVDFGLAIQGELQLKYVPSAGQWLFDAAYLGVDVFGESASAPIYVYAAPPIYFRYEVGGELFFGVGFKSSSSGGVEPQVSLNSDSMPEIRGIVGCGVSGLLAVEGYAALAVKFDITAPPVVCHRFGVGGKIGVELVVIGWGTGPIDIYSGTLWIIAPNDLVAPTTAEFEQLRELVDRLDSRAFRPLPRGYLKTTTPYSAFLGGRMSNPQLWGDPVASGVPMPLQTSIWPYSEPALGVSGTNRFLLLVTDNPERSDENRTELLWSKWNGSTWVNPTSVWNDATADFAPAVKVFPDGRALAVWQNERAILTNGATLDQALAGLEIAAGWFNPASNAWSCSNLTDNLTLDQGPKLDAAANGKALVAWISNPSNSPLGSVSAPNTICSRFWDGAGWQNPGDIATNAGMLLWHTVAFDGTNGVMLAALDLDDDQSTITNQELYGAAFNGTSWSSFTRLTTNNVQDTKPQAVFDSAGHLLVVWYQDTNLVMHTGDLNLSGPTVIGAVGGASSAKDFRLITGPAGQVTLLWEDVAEDGTGPDPFIFNYDYALNSWSKPVRLLQNTNLLERSFAGAYSDTGSLLLAYDQVNVQTDTNGAPIFTNNVVDLMYLDYVIGSDLALSPGSLMLSTNNPQPGQTVQVSVLVRNAGETAATNIAVAFYNGSTLIGSTQMIAFLAAGATTNMTINWTIPASLTNQSLSATIDPGLQREDRNRANNSASLVALAPDLAIRQMLVVNTAADRRLISARVVNRGNYACGAPFQVSFRRGSARGPLLGTVAVEALPAGGLYDASREWSMAGGAFTNAYELVYAVADSALGVAELDRSNNTNFVQVATLLDSDNDGLSDADEYHSGTDPHNPDTDGDGVSDGEELRMGKNPLVWDNLHFVGCRYAAGGGLRLTLFGQVGHNYTLLASTNLMNWAPILMFACTNGTMDVFDPDAGSYHSRFYRLAPPTAVAGLKLGLGSARPLGSNGLNLVLFSLPGLEYRIYASGDLVNWTAVTNFISTNATMDFRDMSATNYSRRFYRAVVP
jgi:hypothetical protein